MRVTIIDQEALRALSWKAVGAYLDAAGWRRIDDIPGKSVAYQHTDKDGRLWEILVLLRDDLADYVSRMADAVTTLARVEDRSELDVYDDLSKSGEAAVFKVREQIRKWLAEEGLLMEYFRDADSRFNLRVFLSGEQTVNIVQPISKADSVIIATHILLQDEMGVGFAKLPPQRQRDVILDLLRDLSLLGVEFRGIGNPLTAIHFFVPIFFDGLTKDILVHRMQLVSRALILSAGIFLHALEELDESDRPLEATARLLRFVDPTADGLLKAVG
jgi:hypothetical protein